MLLIIIIGLLILIGIIVTVVVLTKKKKTTPVTSTPNPTQIPTSPTPTLPTTPPPQIIPRNNILVAVGSGNNSISYSLNGLDWVGLDQNNKIFTQGNGIAYNGNIWMAGGNGSNTLAWSDNLHTWHVLGNSLFSSCYNMVWTGSLFMANGLKTPSTDLLAYSYNGIDWIESPQINTLFNNIYKVISSTDESLYIAVGADPLGENSIVYSLDKGINWIASDAISFFKFSEGICWTGVRYIAGGTPNNTSGPSIAYSSNGINWTASPGSYNIISKVTSIISNGNTVVAVGGFGQSGSSIATSLDGGLTWQAIDPTPNVIFPTVGAAAVIWNGSYFIASSRTLNDGTLHYAYSNNGINWTKNTFNGMDQIVNYSWNTYNNLLLSFGGGLNNSISYSYNNGHNWTQLDQDKRIFSITGYDGCFNGIIWVAVGEGTNTIAWSENGLLWNTVTGSPYSAVYRVCWAGSIFIICGVDNSTPSAPIPLIGTSLNGINWTYSNSIKNLLLNCYKIDSNGSITVGVGSFLSTSTTTIVYSLNGYDWFAANTSFTMQWSNSIHWTGNKFIAGGGSNSENISLATSQDGINWTPVQGSGSIINFVMDIISDGSTIVGVGGRDLNQPSIIYSLDNGNTWTAADSFDNKILPLGGHSVIWDGTYFIASNWDIPPADFSLYAYSVNGINWTRSINETLGYTYGFATNHL
jgi:hypothetical protein